MKRSTTRILTTHTGSLARPRKLRDMLLAQARESPANRGAFDLAVREAVQEIVAKQVETGLDVINDGEQSKTGFAQYVRQRLNGFEGEPVERNKSLEARDFPEYFGDRVQWQQPCTGKLSWRDFESVSRDIQNLKQATQRVNAEEVFMNSVSPGTFANNNPNRYYLTREEYILAIADVMKQEYDAIAEAGFLIQIDSPDLTQRSYNFPDLPLGEWRKIVVQNIEALNHATRDIPREQLRVHVCWGAGENPHNHDTELPDVLDLLLTIRASALSVVAANGRHEHEWQVWRDVQLSDGLVVIPGVIDSTTNIVEHPKTVAERLVRFASVLGKENIIAGVDCGFGTVVTAQAAVDPKVAWAKLQALVEGTHLASASLWGTNVSGRGRGFSIATTG